MIVLHFGIHGKRYSTMTKQDRYTELYETWCRVDLINLIIKLEQEKDKLMGLCEQDNDSLMWLFLQQQ